MFVNYKAAIYDDDRESCNRVTFFEQEIVFQLLWYKIRLKKKKRKKKENNNKINYIKIPKNIMWQKEKGM